MGWEYPPDQVFEAEDLFCVERLPMREVSERTEIPESTLWRWADKYEWSEKRRELREAMSSIRTNTIRLRAQLIKNCLGSLNPMDTFAVAKMEELAIKAEESALERRVAGAGADQHFSSAEDAAQALEAALSAKLSQMIANPAALDLGELKHVKASFDLLHQLQPKPDEETGKKPRGMTDASVQEAKRLLGILG
ncbi:hypothetical protein [Desulfohalovibrio reitneri]|uniref:hypothetical protein n=1 Tax=Desulfohalovibrio reitneri TaxID=1307759 RepID=UPI0004A6CD0F|nr:hypothetical protein [Desulfohalovibrio reitneri]